MVFVFTRKKAKVQVVMEEKDRERLLWIIGDYFDVHIAEYLENEIWTIYENISLVDKKLDYETINECTPDGPNSTILLNWDNKALVIHQESEEDPVFYLFRMIRGLLRWGIYDDTVLFLHGGAVNLNGQGVAFLGNKRAGKTSSILSMIVNQGADYVTNDDLMVSFEDDFMAYGWPRSLSIRKDTLQKLNIHQNERIGNKLHPSNIFLKKNDIESEHEYYLPSEVSQLGSGKLVHKTKLKYIIFPQFVDSNEKKAYLEKIDIAEAKERLMENIRINPEKFFQELKKSFDIPDPAYMNEKIDILCKNISFYKLYQTFDALDLGSLQIKKMFETN